MTLINSAVDRTRFVLDLIKRWKYFKVCFKRDWNNIPNKITLTRLGLCLLPPLLVIIYHNDFYMRCVAAAIFSLIAATDFIDGFLARKLNQVTELGKKLDPMVDRALFIPSLFVLSWYNPYLWIVMALVVLYEFFVVQIVFGSNRSGKVISVVQSGRVKMFMMCTAIALLFIPFDGALQWIQIIAVAMTVITMASAYRKYREQYVEK